MRPTEKDAPERPRTTEGEAPAPAKIGGPLDEANDTFHDAYDRARREGGEAWPLLVLLGDNLVLVEGDERRTYAVTPREVHVLKSLAHVPPAAFAALSGEMGHEASPQTLARLGLMRTMLTRVEAALPDDLPDASLREELRPLLDETVALLAPVTDGAPIDERKMTAFAARCGPLLLRATEHATRAQLGALDACLKPLLDSLDPEARAHLQVVVAGDHQARERSLGMQYFRARLGEHPGEQRRVAYGEGVSSVDEAVALVGTRRADRLLASAFFGDAKRLQRDVLGDAATKLLEEAEIEVWA